MAPVSPSSKRTTGLIRRVSTSKQCDKGQESLTFSRALVDDKTAGNKSAYVYTPFVNSVG
jgi:hypothetical protein